jgi:hypothetical protein
VTAATTLTGNVALADGLTVAAPSTLNRAGISVTGNGTGAGIIATSGAGATGNGLECVSGATAGSGLVATGVGTGNGILATGGAGAGGDCIEAAAGGGVAVRGGVTGDITGNLSGSVGSVTAVSAGAILNASFGADVGSTAYATNIIALATDKALVQQNLDHLCKTATAAADMTAEVTDGSIISRMISDSNTSDFDPTADSLHPSLTLLKSTDANVTTIAGLAGMDVLLRTTIATLASQTSFTLTAGSADNDAYNGMVITVQDAVTAAQRAVGMIADYVGATKTVTLFRDPAVYTIATTDIVAILAPR